ncbi:alpha-xenorhabdolysin family binary toxin subunit A [Pseudomonas sp. R1-18]|uniref:alpha-xenorhabdolysin family binary toxin subunit A n=1 Tax=Pseudomonas sp. R1-18 TaxID=1632772 RepID=UPI003DA854CB
MQASEDLPINRLNDVTTHYVQVLAGRTGGGREPGLIVSETDVWTIRRYVASALELPSGLDEVRQLLGYEAADIAGLEPADFQDLYQAVQRHAQAWPGLETGIKHVGTDLVYFSDALRNSGETLITFVEGLEGYRNAIGVLGDLTPEAAEHLPVPEWTVRDRNRKATLDALLDDLRIIIADCSRSTAQVNAGLSAFKRELKTRIGPSLGLKLTLISRNNRDLRLADLNAELEELNREIQAQSDSFEDFLEQQWCLASFAYGLVFPDGQAPQQTRLELLMAQKRELVARIRQDHALLASLAQLQTMVQELRVRVDAAASGASNLESMWILIQTYIDGSARRLHNMTDATFLVVFVARLRSMILSWSEIKQHSQDLLTAFNNAIAQVQA